MVDANVLTDPQSTSIDHNDILERHPANISRYMTNPYYPDDKICLQPPPVTPVKEKDVIENLPRPQYPTAELPSRPPIKPFWKKHLYWILAILALTAIFLGILVAVIIHRRHLFTTVKHTSSTIGNNTLDSVASSGLFLTSNKTWNMHVFQQNADGNITLRLSLDGNSFHSPTPVTLTIKPKIGSPLSATAGQDSNSSAVMINIFYLSSANNITISTIACPVNSLNCTTISNNLLPTNIPVNQQTGLAAVNINNSQGWQVYYHDSSGCVSQLTGNDSSYNTGECVGGQSLNGSSIAAVNTNPAGNHTHLFYTDILTRALYTMEFNANAWTMPTIVSSALISSWNPLSGLGSAYSPGKDQLHVYYTGLDQGVYEFLGSRSSTGNLTFAAQPGRNHLWAAADYVGADITALGWNDQVRFWQVLRGRLVQGMLSGVNWSETFVGP